MKFNTLFKISAVTAALFLAGCGGDINVTPTVNNGGGADGGDTGGGNSGENPCASHSGLQGTFDGLDCSYNAEFAGKNVEIQEDLTFSDLPQDGIHIFDGALQIGQDCDTTTDCTIEQDGPVMTVEAGATLAFTSGEGIIQIARGAQLNAEGTFENPVKFTSANEFTRYDVAGNGPRYADWGGIIINGNGITNQCTDAQRDAGTCNVASEGIVSYYGGNDNADDSGSMTYAQIWYAGSGPRTGGDGDDLNSLTLNGVGSGSSYQYIHIHQGYDDGVELFGGAANLKNIVFTDTQDDSMDIDAGWQGKAQFLYIKHGTVDVNGETAYMGNGGFEADGEKNSGPEYSGAPTSAPVIANVTIRTTDGTSVRDGDPSIATKFDDNFQGKLYNFLKVKKLATADDGCILFTSDGELGVEAGELEYFNSAMACVNEFVNTGDNTFAGGETYSQWYLNGGVNASIGGNATVFADDGFSTDMSSADITVAANDLTSLNDDFFTSVDFIGALSSEDTSSEWYQWVQTALDAAEQD
ncbi:hypothetical protein [Idiomarina sp. HP20-50]|uniref:hypothetical protein n=1 Tax=Idiomarina sp. HP20-50 TaxID=3070813 RepID=UPI00294B7DA1|nr:hypothetical protein [Idiomarina sp. HP20-50]MDV6316175.1 hypothetical protein [Idiomarina sp. HP20-50]